MIVLLVLIIGWLITGYVWCKMDESSRRKGRGGI